MRMRKPTYWYQQSAVLPFRRTAAGLEILLITSRRRKRWILPKGIIEPGMSPQDSAVKEAFEEAGIGGRVGTQALGSYSREKWDSVCHIEVFPFEVTDIFDDWPEKMVRQRRWVTPEDACKLLKFKEVAAMVRDVQRLF
ncbi:NUDIX hydrolase [Candidatus Moduliflexus flocculans]|uniref:NUDIX hydrolase n=1 Tax=Candidatus Moduliflexus flocculans TaxID=1499966 RepID=A0A0S6VVA4_9BACT|nr:NUDIX hydrolase [Candidatus Moduliflexus flocculans]